MLLEPPPFRRHIRIGNPGGDATGRLVRINNRIRLKLLRPIGFNNALPWNGFRIANKIMLLQLRG